MKPVSFHPTDPKNLGTDIFARLIPMRAHEVASIYSEEKAKLMRSIVSSVDEKDQELQYVTCYACSYCGTTCVDARVVHTRKHAEDQKSTKHLYFQQTSIHTHTHTHACMHALKSVVVCLSMHVCMNAGSL